MDYREVLYSMYVSTHTSRLYGEVDLSSIKRQFLVWDKYYRRHLPRNEKIKILDVGCGNGGFLYYLKTVGYKDCFGIDIGKEQIELARKLGIENVEVSDIREFLKDKKGNYDVIFARDFLEHFKKEEIFNILRLIYNALSSNGRFILQSPNGESPFSGKYRYGDFTHEIAFTRTSLYQILRSVGFRKVRVYSVDPVPHGLKSLIRYFLWKIIEVFLKFYMLIETGSGKGIFTQNLICVAEK